jgi:hypothetical protein
MTIEEEDEKSEDQMKQPDFFEDILITAKQ